MQNPQPAIHVAGAGGGAGADETPALSSYLVLERGSRKSLHKPAVLKRAEDFASFRRREWPHCLTLIGVPGPEPHFSLNKSMTCRDTRAFPARTGKVITNSE